jgi:DNA-binding transcriptional MerR regulator
MIDYTVKQLATIAGVSPRTLHYYDEIGLLKPSSVGGNGYRHYDEACMLRLQQILFFRELDFSLADIQETIDQPQFDMIQALSAHRENLYGQLAHLEKLLATIDNTISHIKGEIEMKPNEIFEPFSEEKQKEYEEEVRQRYGEKELKVSQQRWGSYSKEKRQQVIDEGNQNYVDIANNMDKGHDSPDVQESVGRWHQHMHYFYDPTIDVLRGLADMYVNDPAFRKFFDKIHPDLAEFMLKAVTHYCNQLEQNA